MQLDLTLEKPANGYDSGSLELQPMKLNLLLTSAL